ncbi:MAG: GumC family protein [Geminicoccaceae bacterium]
MTTGNSRALSSAVRQLPPTPAVAYGSERDRPSFDIDLSAVLRTLWRQRWVVILCALMGVILAGLFGASIRPDFTSTAKVMLDSRETELTTSQAVLSALNPTDEVVESEIELIQSRSIRERVAYLLDLGLIMQARDQSKRHPLAERIEDWVGPINWNAPYELLPETVRNLLEEEEEPDEPISIKDQIDFLGSRISARQLGNTSVIAISATDFDPGFATELANLTASEYLALQVDWKTSATSDANTWLEDRIQELQQEISEKRVQLDRIRSAVGSVDESGSTLLARQQTMVNERLLDARSARIRLQTAVAEFEQKLAEQGPTALVSEIDSVVVSQLRVQVAALQQELAELSSVYGRQHPTYLDVSARLQSALSGIASEAEKELTRLRTELRAAGNEERELESELARYSERDQSLNDERTEISRLESEVASLQEVLDGYQSRYKETNEQASILRPDARIISQASRPDNPDPPSGKLILLVGFTLATALGLVLAYLRDMLDGTLRTGPDAERILNVPMVQAIPTVPKPFRDAPADYASAKPGSAYAESLRAVLLECVAGRRDSETARVLVTSAVAGEGKSSAAASMARLWSGAGLKVALVECDLRRPSLAHILRLGSGPGLVQFLEGNALPSDILRVDPVSDTTVVCAGSITHNSLSLLRSSQFAAFLSYLESNHQLIIIDSPPVVPLPDAQALAEHVDTAVFLCRWGRTKSAVAASGVRMLVRPAGPLVLAALSQVDMDKYKAYDSAYDQTEYSHYYAN